MVKRATSSSRMPSDEPFRYSTVHVKKSPTGWGAKLLDDHDEQYFIAVEAWSDTGAALVVDRFEGALVPATDQPGFQELGEVRHHTLIPATPGWRISAHQVPGIAAPFTTPIAAWAQDQAGTIEAVAALPDDSLNNPSDEGEMFLQVTGSSRYRILPPRPAE